MRKTIFIALLSSFYLLACNGENNRKGYPTLGQDEVSRMIAKYREVIKDPRNVIQQISVDQKELRRFMQGSERVKLIAAGYEVPMGDTLTTIIVQIMTRNNGKPVYNYYDFRKIFKPTTAGKTGEEGDDNSICPPPDNCGIPLIRQ